MREGAKENAQKIWPNDERYESFPKAKLQEAKRKKPTTEPYRTHETVLLNLYFLHAFIIQNANSRPIYLTSATTKIPAVTNKPPTTLPTVGFSPKMMKASMIVSATLNLSIGATFEASPS
jgi:hypothetical protein